MFVEIAFSLHRKVDALLKERDLLFTYYFSFVKAIIREDGRLS